MFMIFKIALCLTAGVYLLVSGVKMIISLFDR